MDIEKTPLCKVEKRLHASLFIWKVKVINNNNSNIYLVQNKIIKLLLILQCVGSVKFFLEKKRKVKFEYKKNKVVLYGNPI